MDMAATMQPGRLTVQQPVVAVDEGAAGGGHQLADGGGVEDGVGGDGVCGYPAGDAGQCRDGRRNILSRNAVRDDGEHRRVVVPRVADREVGGDPHLLRRLVLAGHHEDHRAVEVRRDSGVERELGRRRDVGVVGPHDEDRVEPVGHGVVAVDDGRHRGVGVVVDVVVEDTGRLVRGHGRDGVTGPLEPRQQQVEHVVVVGIAPSARPDGTPRPGRPAGSAGRGSRRRPPTCPTAPRTTRGRRWSPRLSRATSSRAPRACPRGARGYRSCAWPASRCSRPSARASAAVA